MIEKCILLSVNPPFADWLVTGYKTIEWRKKPLPLGKAYIYETKKNGGCGAVIGEITITGNKKTDGIIYLPTKTISHGRVSYSDLLAYANGKQIFANQCANNVKYATPKDLNDFEKPCPFVDCIFCKYYYDGSLYEPPSCDYEGELVKRPPQSWMYVEEL